MNTITAEALKSRMDAGENLHLLDVREPSERAEFNIGGTLVPLGRIRSMDLDELEDWRDEEVIVYCRSGNRSGQACMVLEQVGFSNVYNLVGGMLDWQAKFGTK
jgi:rhodanese-related sulfurtransferase